MACFLPQVRLGFETLKNPTVFLVQLQKHAQCCVRRGSEGCAGTEGLQRRHLCSRAVAAGWRGGGGGAEVLAQRGLPRDLYQNLRAVMDHTFSLLVAPAPELRRR